MPPQNKLREEMAEQFVQALNMGQLPWEACWQQQRPVNAVTGKQYRGINNLYLSFAAQALGYTDPRWCTYKQAQDKGWQVRKGEKARRVEYWACYDTKQKKLLSWSEVRALVTLDPSYEDNLQLRCRIYSVFNAAQIDGIPELAQRVQTDIGQLRQQRDFLIANMGVGYRETGTDAYYAPKEDMVVLPPEASFDDTYSYMATLLHECGHATGHESRLNRELVGMFGSEPYAKEELRAEIASAFTVQALGLELTPAQRQGQMERHMAYVQSWSQAISDAPEELFRAIKDAEKISDYLIDKGEFQPLIDAAALESQAEPAPEAAPVPEAVPAPATTPEAAPAPTATPEAAPAPAEEPAAPHMALPTTEYYHFYYQCDYLFTATGEAEADRVLDQVCASFRSCGFFWSDSGDMVKSGERMAAPSIRFTTPPDAPKVYLAATPERVREHLETTCFLWEGERARLLEHLREVPPVTPDRYPWATPEQLKELEHAKLAGFTAKQMEILAQPGRTPAEMRALVKAATTAPAPKKELIR